MPTERAVEFPSEGATLRGRLFLPESGRGLSPVVVMAHGSGVAALAVGRHPTHHYGNYDI